MKRNHNKKGNTDAENKLALDAELDAELDAKAPKQTDADGVADEETVGEKSTDASTDTALDLDAELDEALGQRPKAEKKRGFRSLLTVRNIILLVCLVTFIVCAVILIGRTLEYKHADDLYDKLAAEVFEEVKDEPSILSVMPQMLPDPNLYDYDLILQLGKSQAETKPNAGIIGDVNYTRILAKLEELRAVNPDIIGWIKVEGTEINYPLVLGDDNEYYLDHAYNGEYLRSGTIFADYRCSRASIYDNRNTVLYGHNMASGDMFAIVNTYEKHPEILTSLIYIYGFDGIYVYEPFAMLETNSSFYYFQVRFGSDSEFGNFLNKMLEAATWKKEGVELTPDDKILSLSTCSTHTVTGRKCLQARLIRVEHSMN